MFWIAAQTFHLGSENVEKERETIWVLDAWYKNIYYIFWKLLRSSTVELARVERGRSTHLMEGNKRRKHSLSLHTGSFTTLQCRVEGNENIDSSCSLLNAAIFHLPALIAWESLLGFTCCFFCTISLRFRLLLSRCCSPQLHILAFDSIPGCNSFSSILLIK